MRTEAPQPSSLSYNPADLLTGASNKAPDELKKKKKEEKPPSAETRANPTSQSGAPTPKADGGVSLLGRIADAPQSQAKAMAMAQAQLIVQDTVLSEAQVSRIAAMRRQQVGSFFAGARAGLSGFFTRTMAGAQTFIANKQAEITGAATRALTWIRTTITGALQTARTAVGQVRATINRTLDNIKTSVQNRVDGIKRGITGVIDSVPFPNVPGTGWIRSAAVGLLNQAAGAVNSAVGLVHGFIRTALNLGLDALDKILSGIQQVVEKALSLAISAVQTILQTIARVLSRVVAVVGSIVQRALLAVIVPILRRVESAIAGLINGAERQALSLLRANRDQYLAALAEMVVPGPDTEAQESKGGAPCNPLAAMQQLARDAIQNNRLIVQTFEFVMGGGLATLSRILAATAARILAAVTALFTRAFRQIASTVARVIERLTQMAEAVGKFVMALLEGFVSALSRVAEFVRSVVQGGVDKFIHFAEGGLGRLRSFVTTFVSNLLRGRGVSASAREAMGEFSLVQPSSGRLLPFPGPFFKPPPTPTEIIIELIFAFLALMVLIFGEGVGVVIGIIILIVVLILLLILIFYLLYLLWKWLTKPRKPKPCPCTIVTKTLVSAPDGTADTRSTVGVNERVEMTASTSSNWSASRGSVSPTTGVTTIWTAPGRKASSCTIKAKPVAGASPCKVTMKAIEPTENRQKVKTTRTYTAGLAGSGFIGDVTLMPLNVSFSRLETREDTATGRASGYYRKVLGWNGIKHPPGTFAPVDNKNGEGTDTVGTVPPGTAGPFSKGRFHWPIPQLYRIAGGSAEIKYSTGDHIQEMVAGSSGEETTSKEGASNKRKP